jgi:hypothetical protein
MKRLITLLLLFAGISSLLFCQDFALPDLQGYKKVSDYPVYTRDNLWDFIDGAADNYLAFGFEELIVTEYVKGKNSIKLEIYRHKDNTEAFGIYSSEKSASFRFLNIGTQGYKADASLNFFKGKYYVKLRTNSRSDKTIQMLETLALKVADALPGEAVMPKTLHDFPENGKKRNEETYINEGVLGHEFLKGAFKATYELSDLSFAVYIIDNKNNEDRQKVVNAYLAKGGLDPDISASGKYVFRDGYNGDIFLSWKENRLVIIQGLEKDQTDLADRYTTEILK